MAKIKELPSGEKPREKALQYGVSTLSNRELLALLLTGGIKGESVLQIADALLKKAGGIQGLERLTRKDLCGIRGISDVKATMIEACFEIAKRCAYEKTANEDVVEKPAHLIAWLQKELGPSLQEKFMVIYLDASHHILKHETLFIGTVNAASVYPRDVIREAVANTAVSLILVHNHPAGSLVPSAADCQVTKLIVDSAALVGISVTDHIIITRSGWFSFAESGMLSSFIEGKRKE